MTQTCILAVGLYFKDITWKCVALTAAERTTSSTCDASSNRFMYGDKNTKTHSRVKGRRSILAVVLEFSYYTMRPQAEERAVGVAGRVS